MKQWHGSSEQGSQLFVIFGNCAKVSGIYANPRICSVNERNDDNGEC